MSWLLWRPETFHQVPKVKQALAGEELLVLRSEVVDHALSLYGSMYARMRAAGVVPKDWVWPSASNSSLPPQPGAKGDDANRFRFALPPVSTLWTLIRSAIVASSAEDTNCL